MEKTQVVNTSRHLFLFAGQLAVFIFCFSFINFFYYENILPDREVKNFYQQTTCTVLQKTLSERGRFFHEYRSDFLVSYTANGRLYRSQATGNGLDQSYTSNRQSQEAALDQFEVGQNFDCWFNPAAPQLVVLVLRHSWTSTFPLLIPTAIAIIAFYYMGRSFFAFLGVATVKTREIREKRKKKKQLPK